MWGRTEYVPVATRLAQAKRKVEQLRKKGKAIEPIEIQGRLITKKFWGKLWCKHLESFSDYSNRLPRGRTYVRNGSVCHLRIDKGCVEALVVGSSMYHVQVNISTLSETIWKMIKDKCSGQIASLLELLQGKLSDHVMEVVADYKQGLFPKSGEMHFSCDCLDWAGMCKHIAAVLYGIGSRLDEQPELLFQLRGVDASELIATNLTIPTADTEDLLDDAGLQDIFGIELDSAVKQQTPQPKKAQMTGKQLQKLRKGMKMTVREFARVLEVTSVSVYRWEKKKGRLNLHTRSSNAIATLLEKNGCASK